MARVGGFGPAIIGDVEGCEELGELFGVLEWREQRRRRLPFRRFAPSSGRVDRRRSGSRHLLRKAVVACEDVGEDFFVGVTDVWRAVGVVDGGGEKDHVCCRES